MSLVIGPQEFTRGQGAGRADLPTARPVTGPPPNNARTRSTAGGGGGVRASDNAVRAWEVAYRRYGHAWEATARSGKGDPTTAREMAAASWAVAAAWRQIATATTLPWWTLAAIESAVGAFEAQAQEYETDEVGEES
ncbi:MAG: hypothetical protein LC749_20715 [Actinobacteria bacterium]|nr:hypothetical protein [Actinomycetota bacterium]